MQALLDEAVRGDGGADDGVVIGHGLQGFVFFGHGAEDFLRDAQGLGAMGSVSRCFVEPGWVHLGRGVDGATLGLKLVGRGVGRDGDVETFSKERTTSRMLHTEVS